MKKEPFIGVELKVYIGRKKGMDEAWVDKLVTRLEKEHGMVCYAKILAEEVVLVWTRRILGWIRSAR
jgi:hypothetical protein